MPPSSANDVEAVEEGVEIGVQPQPLERGVLRKERSTCTRDTADLSVEFSTSVAEKEATPTTPNRCRRWIVVLGVVALVAAAGLGTGLAVGLAGRSTASTEGDDPAPSTSTPQFDQRKAFIDEVCSSEDFTSTCQEACSPADCCDPSSETSCIAEKADSCFAYSKCHVVQPQAFAPPAPMDLADTCSKSDLTACREACQPAECCFTSDHADSCAASHLMTCLDYAPCQALKPNAALPPAPPLFWDFCSYEKERVPPECDTACQAASCCWDDSSERSCLDTDFITCLTYAPCEELRLAQPHSLVPEPTKNTTEVCSIDSLLDEGGYQECKAACGSASCCSSTKDNSCFSDDPFGCSQYNACERLPLAGGSVPRAPDNLEELCNINGEGNNTLNECIEACKPAACCEAQGDENCVKDGNALACREYGICEPVHALGRGNLESPPDNLSQICSRNNLATAQGYTACFNVCAPAACCNSLGDDNCLLENVQTCGEWNIGGCYRLTR